MRLVLLGAPGSGKGTQAVGLAKAHGIPAISTGDMLRDAVGAGSALGEKVSTIMAAGDLVDDLTMAEVVRDRLARDDARKGFLLDGYPRTLDQAATLNGILDDAKSTLDAVVMIDVEEAELVRRALSRNRADDTEEVIANRLRVYRDKTEPLVGHYEEHGLLVRVDGNQSVEQVGTEILNGLGVTS